MHQRLAHWHEACGRPAVAGHHAASAQAWPHLLRLVQTSLLDTESNEAWLFEPTAIETLSRLIDTCAGRPAPPDCLLALRCRFLGLCAECDEWERILKQLPITIQGLEQRCGLSDFAELSSLPASERLSVAIARAEARQAERPDGLSLLAALTYLPDVLLTGASAAVFALDVELAKRLPSLEPLFPLSPVFVLIERLITAIVECRERVDTSLSECQHVYGVLAAGPVPGLTEHAQVRLLQFALGFLQAIEAAMGRPEVLERLETSAGRNPKQVARERHIYYVAIGDVQQAARARQRLERLEIFGGAQKSFPTNWESEYASNALTDNLKGLKLCEQQAMDVARQLPNWSMRVELARVAQLLCAAPSEPTLQRIRILCERTVWGTTDGRSALFLQFECLFAMGRYEECRSLMQTSLDRLGRPCEWFDGFEIFLARSEAALGHHDAARARAERFAQMYLGSGVRGVLSGRTYEELARIGLLIGDVSLFRVNAKHCAEAYKCGFNPALTARYEGLLLQAKALQVAISEEQEQAAEFPNREPISQLVSQFNTQLSTCLSPADRLRTMLTLAVQSSGAEGGYLYIAHGDQLRLEASQAAPAELDRLNAVAQQFWQSELSLDDIATATAFNPLQPNAAADSLVLAGERLTPLLLRENEAGVSRCWGVLILAAPEATSLQVDPQLAEALSLLLAKHDILGQPSLEHAQRT